MNDLAARARRSAKQSFKRPARQILHRLGYEISATQADAVGGLARLLEAKQVRTVIDVGANQGQYADQVRHLGFRGRMHSFEPGAAAYAQLSRAARSDPTWTVHQLALGSEPGVADLQVSHNSVSSSLLAVEKTHVDAAPESRTDRTEQVRVSTLDAECAEVEGPVLLKIDTQGYELPVLRGASRLLDRVEVVQVELSFVPLYAGQSHYLELLGFLEDAGFAPFQLIPGFSDTRTGRLLQADLVSVRKTP